jgi:peptidoglycan biosynthesis protein MviN/MurJ (putative lipid II flippase)
MDLMARVKGILLKPKEEWVKIKTEPTTVVGLFTSYAMILAAVPAVANFIGLALIGQRIPFYGWYRYKIGNAFLYMIISYILSLVAVYVLGIVINALASTFSSKQDINNAMKLAVYSMTASWVAGVFYIIPVLGILALLGSLYSLYILYLGFDNPLMDTPKEKVIGYFVVSLVVAIVLMVVISLVLGAIFTVGSLGGRVL